MHSRRVDDLKLLSGLYLGFMNSEISPLVDYKVSWYSGNENTRILMFPGYYE